MSNLSAAAEYTGEAPPVRAASRKSSPYLGSVRFFKHLILAALALMILIPSVLCVALGTRAAALKMEVAKLVAEQQAAALQAAPVAAPSPTPAGEGAERERLYPELYAAPTARSTVDVPKTCYLTFDDGPSERTPEILEILERYGVKATFFVVGKEDEQSRQWMRDIVAAGHTLGMHSYTHDYQTIYASADAFLEDYERIYHLILEATGTAPQISRFPGGSINGYNGATYQDMIAELVRRGFVYFDWNAATGDAAESGLVPAATLTKNALDRVSSLRRAVLLMHDSQDKTTTVEALPAIIEGYREAGFTFAALTPEVKPVIYSYPK